MHFPSTRPAGFPTDLNVVPLAVGFAASRPAWRQAERALGVPVGDHLPGGHLYRTWFHGFLAAPEGGSRRGLMQLESSG